MSVIVDELFEMLGATEGDFQEGLDTFEQEQGIDVRRDIAAPLGGEIAVALDGPILPKPSWKVVIEVYDPARLQQTLEWFVEHFNMEVAAKGDGQGLAISSETIGGREYHRIESLDIGFGLHYVFDGGYLVAGPSRGLLDRALQNREAGIRLTDSRTFIDMLPRDGEINFSGVVYQNMSPILGPLSGALDSVSGVPDDQRSFFQAMASEAKPSLALLYGHRDRIALTSSSEGGLFSSMMNQLSGATGLMVMPQSLTRALEEAHNGR
jgi:hypothetical protein